MLTRSCFFFLLLTNTIDKLDVFRPSKKKTGKEEEEQQIRLGFKVGSSLAGIDK